MIPASYAKPVNELAKLWSKYSAFNLLPLRTQGTIEFRHLYGTGDKAVYQQWLTMLRDLWDFAYTQPPDTLKKMLLSNTPVEDICKLVLPSAPKTQVDFSSSLIDVKLAF